MQAVVERESADKLPVDYDPFTPFVVCASSFQPIYRGQPQCVCPYCQATYKPEFKGTICSVCTISKVGGVAN
jgi:coatomer protein complex subunit alpha (xenin)